MKWTMRSNVPWAQGVLRQYFSSPTQASIFTGSGFVATHWTTIETTYGMIAAAVPGVVRAVARELGEAAEHDPGQDAGTA